MEGLPQETLSSFGEKIENESNFIPKHPLSPLLISIIRNYHSDLPRRAREDLYQSSAEFLVKVETGLREKFGPEVDMSNLNEEQVKFVFSAFGAHTTAFRRQMGYTVTQLKKNISFEELSTNENGESVDRVELSTEDNPLHRNEGIGEYLSLCKEAIYRSEGSIEEKDQRWKIFTSFVEITGSDYYVESQGGQKVDVIDRVASKVGLDRDFVVDEINKAIEIIRAENNVPEDAKAFKVTKKGGIMVHNAGVGEKKRVAHLDTTKDNKTLVQEIRDLIGLHDEDEYRRKKGHVYTLLKRAKDNGGVLEYYPGYHDKN